MRIRFILASASPARRRTLIGAGVVPEVLVSGFDESTVEAQSVAQLVQELAQAKARTVAEGLGDDAALVLGCDSLLEFGGLAMGKPNSVDAAMDRWRQLRGGAGLLHTGHALIDTRTGRVASATVTTAVRFAEVTDDEIAAYCASGEPTAVAGGFTIDGLGGWFVESLDGDPHNVVGVSLPTLRLMLRELGFGLADIGYPASGEM
ncbi:MAG: Maf-like protein [Actinomycetota bacterium]|nr:Maf-like protein [Actinomycetota bacterium]